MRANALRNCPRRRPSLKVARIYTECTYSQNIQFVYQIKSRFAQTGAARNRWVMMTFHYRTPASMGIVTSQWQREMKNPYPRVERVFWLMSHVEWLYAAYGIYGVQSLFERFMFALLVLSDISNTARKTLSDRFRNRSRKTLSDRFVWSKSWFELGLLYVWYSVEKLLKVSNWRFHLIVFEFTEQFHNNSSAGKQA